MSTYQQILTEMGYPTDVICLDFETFFTTAYSLSKIQTIEFIRDPQFCFTGLGIGKPGTVRFIEPQHIGNWMHALQSAQNKYTFVVHNAHFDITVMQEKFGWIPDYILDTKDLAAHYDSRVSLKVKDLAIQFGLKHKGDTLKFKGLYWEDMDEATRAEFIEYTTGDVEIELELFEILIQKLSNVDFEARIMRHTLDMWLHRRFKIDTELAEKLIKDMTAIFDGFVERSGRTVKELRSRDVFRGLMQDALGSLYEVPLKWNKKHTEMIPAFAKTDNGCIELRAHPNEEVRNLIEGRLAAFSWNAHLKRVRRLVSQSQWEGLLRVALNYYGGHTGRYSGGEKINLQNLGSRSAEILICMVRQLLQALDGYTLGITDSAQIEARVVAWLARCDKLLRAFASGEDIYCEFAEELFGCTGLRKPRKTDPKPVQDYLKVRRGVGKQNVLGNVYGMGHEKAYIMCLADPNLRPTFISGQCDKAFVKRGIDKYRRDFPEIPAYWSKVEKAFRRCLRFPHLELVVGCCTFRCTKDREVQITLPSGRVLYYPDCAVSPNNQLSYHAHSAKSYKLWGGVITENIDQAISRDLLCWWILKCEDAGLPSVLHVHDENVTMLKLETAEADLDRQAAIMCSLPDWAEGLPVDCDKQLSPCYTK